MFRISHLSRAAGAAVVVLTLVAAASVRADPTPIVYWSFNNPADIGHDDSDNGHTLTIPGTVNSVSGALGNAASFSGYGVNYTYFGGGFNGTSSPWGPYTSTSTLSYPGSGGLTVAYWVKLTPELGDTTVRDYWQHVAGGETFGLTYTSATEQASFFSRHDYGNSTMVISNVSAAQGSWLHFAGVYDPNGYAVKLYINGQLAAQDNMPGAFRTNIAPYFYVAGSWHQTLPGQLDEVRLYDTALTDAQIAALAIPEPASLALLTLGGAAMLFRGRGRNDAA